MLRHPASCPHESLFGRPTYQGSGLRQKGHLQERDRPQVRAQPLYGQPLPQAARRRRLSCPKESPGKRSKLGPSAVRLLEDDREARPWVIHRQRCEFLSVACGAKVSEATICRSIKRLGLSRKKRSVGASEQDEWLRLVWRSTIGKLDAGRLVFVD